jgi:DNA repair exonuclease SbcCD nuclease subunit
LCGGDLYEHDRFSPETATLLRYAFMQLAPIPVYIAPGNEDWYGPQSLYQQVDWSSNVHVFSSGQLTPATVRDGFTLWGAAHCAPAGAPNFLRDFHVDRGGIHVALFHGSEMGSLAAQGEHKQPHAPFEAAEIERTGLHHLFLGHYHQPREAMLYTYPGNPHPLSFREDGIRGAVIVNVSDQGTVYREWRSVAKFVFHDLDVDLTGSFSRQDIRERIKDAVAHLKGVARVTLRGDLPPDMDFNPKDISDISHSLEGLLLRVGKLQPRFDFEAMAKEPTVRGHFVRDVLASEMEADKRHRVIVTGLRALEGRRELEVY